MSDNTKGFNLGEISETLKTYMSGSSSVSYAVSDWGTIQMATASFKPAIPENKKPQLKIKEDKYSFIIEGYSSSIPKEEEIKPTKKGVIKSYVVNKRSSQKGHSMSSQVLFNKIYDHYTLDKNNLPKGSKLNDLVNAFYEYYGNSNELNDTHVIGIVESYVSMDNKFELWLIRLINILMAHPKLKKCVGRLTKSGEYPSREAEVFMDQLEHLKNACKEGTKKVFIPIDTPVDESESLEDDIEAHILNSLDNLEDLDVAWLKDYRNTSLHVITRMADTQVINPLAYVKLRAMIY